MGVAGLDLLQTITLLVMALGAVMVLLPLIPGLVLIWLAALAYDLIRGFTWRSGIVLLVLTVLMIVGSTTEFWLSSAGARRGGASGWAVLAAVVASVVGLVFLNALAAVLLPALAVLAVEYVRVRDVRHAARAGRDYLIGWFFSTGIELMVALLMIALWLWQVGGWRALVG
jgi:uncharacterized protein YqgC (DUF456 family)